MFLSQRELSGFLRPVTGVGLGASFLLACASAPLAEEPSPAAESGTAAEGLPPDPATSGDDGTAASTSLSPPLPTTQQSRFGADTVGGSGGTVIKVTTLDSSGPGSLREALSASGPRLVVFEVGGVIDLAESRLDISSPNITIAGQTAPAPGISLIRGGMRIMTHDVRIEHLRFRMGDAGAAAGGGFEPDVSTDGGTAYNIVFDHVSVAWGVDENLSVSGPRLEGPMATSHAVTISNSIIAEGLRNSVHEKGAHSMGTLVHDYCSEVLVISNLYASNDERNPWFKGYATGAIVNNVVYNPGKWAMRLGPVDSEWAASGIPPEPPQLSIVGNFMKHGPDTLPGLNMVGTNSRGSAYLSDNKVIDASGLDVAVAAPSIVTLAQKPIWDDGLAVRASTEVFEWVLAHAGARPKERDDVDQRIVLEVRDGTGRIIDSQDAVGGYPAPLPTTRPLEVPDEGVDAWLAELARQLE